MLFFLGYILSKFLQQAGNKVIDFGHIVIVSLHRGMEVYSHPPQALKGLDANSNYYNYV